MKTKSDQKDFADKVEEFADKAVKVNSALHNFHSMFCIVDVFPRFRFEGRELQRRIRTWVKKNRKLGIKILKCEDYQSMSEASLSVVIPHRLEGYCYGMTMVYVPPSGQPTELFFTPKQGKKLKDHLRKIWRKQ